MCESRPPDDPQCAQFKEKIEVLDDELEEEVKQEAAMATGATTAVGAPSVLPPAAGVHARHVHHNGRTFTSDFGNVQHRVYA